MSLFDDLLSNGRQAQWNELQEVNILYFHISKFVEGGDLGVRYPGYPPLYETLIAVLYIRIHMIWLPHTGRGTSWPGDSRENREYKLSSGEESATQTNGFTASTALPIYRD